MKLTTLLLALLGQTSAYTVNVIAQPRQAPGSGYVHHVWTVEDGLPVNSATSIIQSKDGYLWIGTWQGLVRFDGADLVQARNRMSKHIKRDLKDVDVRAILERLACVPIKTWSYEGDPSVRHIGPSSEDLYEVFGFGGDERYIGTIDADGVAMAAIQGLGNEHAELREEVRYLRQRVAKLQPKKEHGD